jgi:hypothetical protein
MKFMEFMDAGKWLSSAVEHAHTAKGVIKYHECRTFNRAGGH